MNETIHPVVAWCESNGNYSEEELSALVTKLQFLTLKKGEKLLEAGEVCSTISFIEKGSVYQYRIDAKMEMRVFALHLENEWVVNVQSFTSRKPSEHTIETFEEVHLYQLTIDQIHNLIGQYPSFFQLLTLLEEVNTSLKISEAYPTPDKRYAHLLKCKQKLLQTFSLKMIASYLNISPETLSRVRSRLNKD